MKDSAKYNASSIEHCIDGILIGDLAIKIWMIMMMGVDRGKRSKQNRRIEYDAWAPNNLLVVKIQILAIFIHSWTNKYKLFSLLKCPIFQRELINFLFPRAPLAQLSLIGTPGERAPEAKKGTQGPEGGLIGNSTVISLTSTIVVNLRNTNHTPTTSHDKSHLRVGPEARWDLANGVIYSGRPLAASLWRIVIECCLLVPNP